MDDRTESQLTPEVVETLKSQGFSQSEIARLYGVTRQYISWMKKQYGGSQTPREMVLQHFPFNVSAEHNQAAACKRLRDHGEFFATGGRGMPEWKLNDLRRFYKRLRDENLVVEYDPHIPPEPGVNKWGGFAYRDRSTEDGDLLIRVNRYTDLTDYGEIIWRFPPFDP